MRLRQITRLFLFLIFTSVTLELYAQEFNHFELNDKAALSESSGGTGELDPNDIRNFSPIYSQIINKYSSTYQGISDRLNDENLPGFFGGFAFFLGTLFKPSGSLFLFSDSVAIPTALYNPPHTTP